MARDPGRARRGRDVDGGAAVAVDHVCGVRAMKCLRCRGTGVEPLSATDIAVLDVLPSARTPIEKCPTTSEVAFVLGIKATTAGNRLLRVASRGKAERVPVPGHDRYRWRKRKT